MTKRKRPGIAIEHPQDLESVIAATIQDLRQRAQLLGIPARGILVAIDHGSSMTLHTHCPNENATVFMDKMRRNVSSLANDFLMKFHQRFDA